MEFISTLDVPLAMRLALDLVTLLLLILILGYCKALYVMHDRKDKDGVYVWYESESKNRHKSDRHTAKEEYRNNKTKEGTKLPELRRIERKLDGRTT